MSSVPPPPGYVPAGPPVTVQPVVPQQPVQPVQSAYQAPVSSVQNPVPVSKAEDPIDTTPNEITLVSHSNLFYWWPVWAVAFVMAAWTFFEGNRLAIVPSGSTVTRYTDTRITPEPNGQVQADADTTVNTYVLGIPKGKKTFSFETAAGTTEGNREKKLAEPAFKPRISERAWPGVIFVMVVMLTVIITNVPLRGLWSFIVIITVIALVLLLALLGLWERIFEYVGALHIHINMAGYLTIGALLFGIWALATFLFDRRSFVTFRPGQVQICEHIGDAVQNYSSNIVQLEKQRDDVFRHYIYGLGSGDLILKIGGSERKDIPPPKRTLPRLPARQGRGDAADRRHPRTGRRTLTVVSDT